MENSTWYAPRRFVLLCLAQVEYLNVFPILHQKERTASTQVRNTVAKFSLETSSHSKSKRLNCKYCIFPLSQVESVIYVLVCVLLRNIPRTAMVMSLEKGVKHRHSWIGYQLLETPSDCFGDIRSSGWAFPAGLLTSRIIYTISLIHCPIDGTLLCPVNVLLSLMIMIS